MDRTSSEISYVSSILQINGKDYPLHEGVNIIGRNKTATVPIKNLNVSQYHAIITIVDANKHYLSDLQTCNGTLLENDKLEPLRLYEIKDGSNIQFANLIGIYKKVSQNSTSLSNLNKNDEMPSEDTQAIYGEATQPIENMPTENLKCALHSNVQNYFDDDYNFENISTQSLYSKKVYDFQQTSTTTNTFLSIHELPTQIYSTELNGETVHNIHDMTTQLITNEDEEIDINNISTQIIHNNNKNNEEIIDNIHDAPTQIMDVLNSSIQSNIEVEENESLRKFDKETSYINETLIIDETITDNSVINPIEVNMPNLELSQINTVSSLNSDTQFDFNVKLLKHRNYKPISDSDEDNSNNVDSEYLSNAEEKKNGSPPSKTLLDDKTEQFSDNDKTKKLSLVNDLQNKDEMQDSDTDIDEEKCTMLTERDDTDGCRNEKKIETNNESRNSNRHADDILNDELNNVGNNVDNVETVNSSKASEYSDSQTDMEDLNFAMEIEIESNKDITDLDAQSNIKMTCVDEKANINSDLETDLDDSEEINFQTKENEDKYVFNDNESTQINIENKNCKTSYIGKTATINISDSETDMEDNIDAQIETKTSDCYKNNSSSNKSMQINVNTNNGNRNSNKNSDSETDSDLENDVAKRPISNLYSNNFMVEEDTDDEDIIIPASQISNSDSEDDDFNFESVKCCDANAEIVEDSNLNKNSLNYNDNIIGKTPIKTKHLDTSVNNDNADNSLTTANNKDVIVTDTDTITSVEVTSSLELTHDKDTDSDSTRSPTILSPKVNTIEDISLNKTKSIIISDSIFKKQDEDIFLPPTQPVVVYKIPTDNSVHDPTKLTTTSTYLHNKELDENIFLQPTQRIALTDVSSNETSHIENVFLQPTQPIEVYTNTIDKEICHKDKRLNSPVLFTNTKSLPDRETDDIFLQPTQRIEITNIPSNKVIDNENIFSQPTQSIVVVDASLNKETYNKTKSLHITKPVEITNVCLHKTTPKEDIFLQATQPVEIVDTSLNKSTCSNNKTLRSTGRNEDTNVSLNKLTLKEDIFLRATQPVITFDASLSTRSKNKPLHLTEDVEATNVSSNRTSKEDACLQSTQPVITFDASLSKTTNNRSKTLHSTGRDKDANVSLNKITVKEDIFQQATQPVVTFDASLGSTRSKKNPLRLTGDLELTKVSSNKTSEEDACLQSTQPVVAFDASLSKSTNNKSKTLRSTERNEDTNVSLNKITLQEDIFLKSTQPVVTFYGSLSTRRKKKPLHVTEDVEITKDSSTSKEDSSLQSTQRVVTFDASLSKTTNNNRKTLHSTGHNENANVSLNKITVTEDIFLQATQPVVTFDASLGNTRSKKKALHSTELNEDTNVSLNKLIPKEDIFLQATQPVVTFDASLGSTRNKKKPLHVTGVVEITKDSSNKITSKDDPSLQSTQPVVTFDASLSKTTNNKKKTLHSTGPNEDSNVALNKLIPKEDIFLQATQPVVTFDASLGSTCSKKKALHVTGDVEITKDSSNKITSKEDAFLQLTQLVVTFDASLTTRSKKKSLHSTESNEDTVSSNKIRKEDIFLPLTQPVQYVVNKSSKFNQDNLNESEKSNIIRKSTENKVKPVTTSVMKKGCNQNILNSEKCDAIADKGAAINDCTTEVRPAILEVTASNNQSKTFEIEEQLEAMFASQSIKSKSSLSLVQNSVEAEEKISEAESQFEVSFATQTLKLNPYSDFRPSNPLITILDSQNNWEENNTSFEKRSETDEKTVVPKNKYKFRSNTNSCQTKHKAIEKSSEITKNTEDVQVNSNHSLKTKEDNYKEIGRSTRSKRKISQSKDEFIDSSENKSNQSNKQIKVNQFDISNESSIKNASTIKTRSNKCETDKMSSDGEVIVSKNPSLLLQSTGNDDKTEVNSTKKNKNEFSKPSSAKNFNSTKLENKSCKEKKSNKKSDTVVPEVEEHVNLNRRSTRSKKVDQELVSDIENINKKAKINNSNVDINREENSENSNSSDFFLEKTPNRRKIKRAISSNKKEETFPKKRKINASSSENEDKNICTTSKQNEVHDATVDTPTRNRRKLKPKVVFTMLDSPELESAIRSLGGTIVDSVETCTVLVTGSLKRSQKLLSAVGYGKPICSPYWIQQCKKANNFLDPWDFILEDTEAEQKWQFSLKESLNRSSRKKLFENITVLVLVTNANDVLKAAVESCGGKCVTKIPSAKPADKQIIIIANSENKAKYSKYLKQKPPLTVVVAEAIFDGVLRQELQLEKHLLS